MLFEKKKGMYLNGINNCLIFGSIHVHVWACTSSMQLNKTADDGDGRTFMLDISLSTSTR